MLPAPFSPRVSSFLPRCGFALCVALLAAVSPLWTGVLAPVWGQAAPDLQVILVGDTQDASIGAGCLVDLQNMESLLRDAPKGKTVNVAIFSQKHKNNFAQDLVAQHLLTMPLGKHTGVIFYFTGHGSYSTQSGHLMSIPPTVGQANDRFANEQIAKLLAARKVNFRQLIIISDSCAPNVDARKANRRGKGPNAKRSQKRQPYDLDVVQMLFYDAQCVVSINGCSEHQYAWGPANIGGIFTVGFLDALARHRKNNLPGDRAHGNGAGFLTWREFFPEVVASTENTYQSFLNQLRNDGAKAPHGPDDNPQTKQTPQVFVIKNFEPKRHPDLPPKYIFGAEMAKETGGGVRILKVLPGTPASKVFQPGDIVRKINKKSVRDIDDCEGIMDFLPDPMIAVTFFRNGQENTEQISLQVRSENERRKK